MNVAVALAGNGPSSRATTLRQEEHSRVWFVTCVCFGRTPWVSDPHLVALEIDAKLHPGRNPQSHEVAPFRQPLPRLLLVHGIHVHRHTLTTLGFLCAVCGRQSDSAADWGSRRRNRWCTPPKLILRAPRTPRTSPAMRSTEQHTRLFCAVHAARVDSTGEFFGGCLRWPHAAAIFFFSPSVGLRLPQQQEQQQRQQNWRQKIQISRRFKRHRSPKQTQHQQQQQASRHAPSAVGNQTRTKITKALGNNGGVIAPYHVCRPVVIPAQYRQPKGIGCCPE